ncbi:MAG: MBL fold metallo-hydrolase [Fimbriimonadaceae bacterium]|nr:MBL fold metallo-hydrolase [Fimbriimonadaceae bacterium]
MRRSGSRGWRWATVGVGLLALASGFVAERLTEFEGTRLTFLSVGQGDCAVFQHQGRTLVLDVGPRTPYTDAGKRYVAPGLGRLGSRTIDLLLLTHPDLDHIGGLPSVARRFRIGRVGVPAHFRGHPVLTEILREARVDESKVWWIDGDFRGRIGAFTVELRIPTFDPGSPDNDGSLLMRIAAGRASAVFTGDAGFAEEAELIRRVENGWRSQILKAGHHGSRSSTSEEFLEAIRPREVIISCGAGNTYGHPNQATLDRIRSAGASVARTDREGDLSYVPGENGFVRERRYLAVDRSAANPK